MNLLKNLLSVLIFVGITQFNVLAQENEILAKDISPSEHHINHQLDFLQTALENLKLRLEMMDLQLQRQRLHQNRLEEKFEDFEEKLNELPEVLLALQETHYNELKNLLETLKVNDDYMASQTEFFGQDGKTEILKEFQKVSKMQETILEKLYFQMLTAHEEQNLFDKEESELSPLDSSTQAPGGNTSCSHIYTKILGHLDGNVTLSDIIDTKLKMIAEKYSDESEKHMKSIGITQELLKFLNKKENSKICIKNKDQKLVCTDESYPSSCNDYSTSHCTGNKCRLKNPIYGPHTFLAVCEDIIDGGGWLVIQRRFNGSVDFYRGWSEYKNGFGNLDGEFWMGLHKLYALTTALGPMELLIHLGDHHDIVKYAKYDNFAIGNEESGYELKDIGNYEGNAGDALSFQKGYKFSTKDKDNDFNEWLNCADEMKGAWWYDNCQASNLNGLYYKNGEVPISEQGRGITWGKFHGLAYSWKFVQMMIRPKMK
ncbi:fibrinogen-like protein 1 isoform X2 [Stomoxys calcitrans]|uniref:Fibrinogen C-terminal domain-containing protein n=1 Tax=Stomoxys calcitrans TaxID=35570 RepID=A0A1I8PX40_STOCA|nr:fibrinogen-like protein 1 isoform X2 [Stomoxys calcitrans]